MVLSPPPPDPEPGQGDLAWLRRILRLLELAQRQVVILVRSETHAGLRALVMALERRPVPLRVYLEPEHMLDAPEGATVLLELRPEHAQWLNMHRTVLVSRRLALVAWASEAHASHLANAAPDFWDWISHLVDAPGGPHGFARRGLLEAGSCIAWFGDDLDGLREASGRAGPTRRIIASVGFAELVDAAKAPGWLMVEALDHPDQLVRLRWALAEARRSEPCVLVRPSLDTLPGWCPLHDRPLAWAAAHEQLRELGVREPAQVAALLDFEPEALARAGALVGLPEARRHELLYAVDPGVAVAAVARGSDDALAWRAGLGSERPEDEVEALLRHQPTVQSWLRLAELALSRQQWDVAQRWAGRVDDPAAIGAADAIRSYAVSQRRPPRVYISYSPESEGQVEAVVEFANHLRAQGVLAQLDRFIASPRQGWPQWILEQLRESDFVIGVCSPTGLSEWQAVELATIPNHERKLVLVTFEEGATAQLPPWLRDRRVYEMPGDQAALHRLLTDQPDVVPAPLGGQGAEPSDRLRRHNLPPRPLDFVDRAAEFDLLHEHLKDDGSLVAVVGMAGVGKSALVLEYAHRNLHKYDVVAWVQVGGREHAEVVSDLAQVLLEPERALPSATTDRLTVVREALKVRRALLVLDDVRDAEELRLLEASHVLLTTRRRDLSLPAGAGTVEIGVFEPSDALQVLLGDRRVQGPQLRAARELCETLGRLPLALALARGMLERGERTPLELLSEMRTDRGHDRLSLDTVLLRSLAQLDPEVELDDLARDVLWVAACLGDAAIPNEVIAGALAHLRGARGTAEAMRAANGRLVTLSLATADDHGLRLHPMIIRSARRQASEEHERAAMHGLAQIVGRAGLDTLVLLDLAELQPHLREVVARMQPGASSDEFVLALGLARQLLSAGIYEEALRVCEGLLAWVEDVERRAWLLDEAGRAQHRLGRYDEAQRSYREAIELKEKAYGMSEHPEVASSHAGLAKVLASQGILPEAERSYRESIRVQEEAYETREHPSLAVSLAGLATVLSRQGKYEEPAVMYRESIRIQEKAFGTNEHPEIAASLAGLAQVLADQGDYEQAEVRYRESIRIQEKVYGTNEHPEIAASLAGLAQVLANQGNYEQAEVHYRESIRIQEKMYGSELPPDRAASLDGLATVLSRQGKYEEAEGLYRNYIMHGKAQQGEVVQALNRLTEVLMSQGKYEEAAQTFRDILTIETNMSGSRTSPTTLPTLRALAELLLWRLDRLDEAWELASETWQAAVQQGLPLEIVKTGPVYLASAAACDRLDEVRDARPVLLEALQRLPAGDPVRVAAEAKLRA